MGFLAKKLAGLGGGEGGGVFCYVNSVFAPGLDEGVGGLWRVSSWSNLFLGAGDGVGEREGVEVGVGVIWEEIC